MSWFWCLEHKCAEQELGGGSKTRNGPYETQAEAIDASQRNEKREPEPPGRQGGET